MNLRTGSPFLSFLILLASIRSTRQSATAAAAIKTSAGRDCWTAASISLAVSTQINCTPTGGGIETGPLTKTTSAPACAAARAIACPCLPDDRLAINRTGSIGSCVGPEVTMTFFPSRGRLFAAEPLSRSRSIKLAAAFSMSKGSVIRPGPKSPQAIDPSPGPIKKHPSSFARSTLRRVAA